MVKLFTKVFHKISERRMAKREEARKAKFFECFGMSEADLEATLHKALEDALERKDLQARMESAIWEFLNPYAGYDELSESLQKEDLQTRINGAIWGFSNPYDGYDE